MNDKFFRENDHEINGKLSKNIRWLMVAVPIMLIVRLMGFFEIEPLYFINILVFGLLSTCVPHILYTRNASSDLVKYYMMISISVTMCILGSYPPVGIYITLILGVLLSLLYFDPSLTIILSLLDYILMIICEYFRMFSFYAGTDMTRADIIHKWIAYSMGFTIEFLIVCPISVWIARMARDIIVSKQTVLEDLEREKRRYSMALENSLDVIFEYDIDSDLMKYYGAILPYDIHLQKGKTYETEIKSFVDTAIDKGLFLSDRDIFMDFFGGNCEKPIEVRFNFDGRVFWYEFEGAASRVDGFPTTIIGKARDITERKREERNLLEKSDKDSLTGFYDKIVGLRLIEEHSADKSDSTRVCMYIDLVNYSEIESRGGSVFADAMIARMADVVKRELMETEMAIRLSKHSFLLYLGSRTANMIEALLNKFEDSFARIYTGRNVIEKLDVECTVYPSLEQVHSILLGDNTDDKDNDDDDNVVALASNMLERAEDIESAVYILLDRIGGIYDLDRIIIFNGKENKGILKCLFEWTKDGAFSVSGNHRSLISLAEYRDNPSCLICSSEDDVDAGVAVCIGKVFETAQKRAVEAKIQSIFDVMIRYYHRRGLQSTTQSADVLSAMSYGVRTPMNAIYGFTNLMLHEELSPVVQRHIENIRNSADSLMKVINNIIDLTSMEAGRLELSDQRYYLHEYIDELRSIADDRAKDKELWFIFKKRNSMPDGLIGDGSRIFQIMESVVDDTMNSIIEGQVGLEIGWEEIDDKAGSLIVTSWSKGTTVSKNDKYVADEIDVVDDASLEAMEAKAINGRDMSVTVAKGLLRLMGGDMSIENLEDGESVRRISIPQRVFDTRDHQYGSIRSLKKYSDMRIPFTASRARALVVDDNRINLEVAKGLIGNYKLSVVTANSGVEAIDILKADQDFDIVFMDYLMPEMDGIEATQQIRGMGNPKLQRIPIIALTANIVKGMEDKYYLSGMNEVLSKPINLSALAEIMMRYIPREKYDYRE